MPRYHWRDGRTRARLLGPRFRAEFRWSVAACVCSNTSEQIAAQPPRIMEVVSHRLRRTHQEAVRPWSTRCCGWLSGDTVDKERGQILSISRARCAMGARIEHASPLFSLAGAITASALGSRFFHLFATRRRAGLRTWPGACRPSRPSPTACRNWQFAAWRVR